MKVFIINIPTQIKRRNLSQGMLLGRDTPFEKIHFWRSIHHRKYKDRCELLEAAINDGFSGFENYLNDIRSDKACTQHLYRPCLGQLWNYCRLLRHVIEIGETIMYIQDDRRMARPYHTMLKRIVKITSTPNFHFLSLWCDPVRVNTEEHRRHNDNYIHGVPFGGACVNSVVSPKGAQWILENVVGIYPNFREVTFERCLEATYPQPEGFYTNIDDGFSPGAITGNGLHTKKYLGSVIHEVGTGERLQ